MRKLKTSFQNKNNYAPSKLIRVVNITILELEVIPINTYEDHYLKWIFTSIHTPPHKYAKFINVKYNK